MFLTSVSLLFFLPVCLPLSQCVWVSGWLGPVCVGTALMIGLCVCVCGNKFLSNLVKSSYGCSTQIKSCAKAERSQMLSVIGQTV